MGLIPWFPLPSRSLHEHGRRSCKGEATERRK